MTWARRDWLLAAGAMPNAFQSSSRGDPDPLPAQGLPPSLPDKASFPSIRGVSLNAAATHPRPKSAMELIRRAHAAELGEPDSFRPDASRICGLFARLVNADPSEIVLVPSTQAGESFIAAALGVPEKGSHIVSDHLHFVGSQEMYTDMARLGVEVTWVRMRENGIPLEEIDKAIRKGKTKLVAISSTSFVNGFQHDVKRVCEIAHAKGAMVYADIIQSAGNVPVDVKDWGVDAACAATYKWLMSAGTAFLYVRKESQAKMRPPIYHFSQYTTLLPTTHMYPFDTPGGSIVDNYRNKDGAAGMFSMGYEPKTSALAGLEYTLTYILNVGPEMIQAHAQPLVERLKTELPKRGYPLLTPRNAKSPIVTAVVKNAEQLSSLFRAAQISVTTRWNHIRVAPSVFNDMEDIERFLAILPQRL